MHFIAGKDLAGSGRLADEKTVPLIGTVLERVFFRVFQILLKISSWFWIIKGNIWKYFPRDAGNQGPDMQKFY
jgi:hypothetical protein